MSNSILTIDKEDESISIPLSTLRSVVKSASHVTMITDIEEFVLKPYTYVDKYGIQRDMTVDMIERDILNRWDNFLQVKGDVYWKPTSV